MPAGVVVDREHDKVVLSERVQRTSHIGGNHSTEEGAKQGFHGKVVAGHF